MPGELEQTDGLADTYLPNGTETKPTKTTGAPKQLDIPKGMMDDIPTKQELEAKKAEEARKAPLKPPLSVDHGKFER